MRTFVNLVATDDIQWLEGSTAEVIVENGLFIYRVDGVVQVGIEEEHLHSERVFLCKGINDLHYINSRLTKDAIMSINRDQFTLEGPMEKVRPVYLELLKYLNGKHT